MPRDPSPPACAEFEYLERPYVILSYQIPQNPVLLELTPAELEVLELWLDGASAEEVAQHRGSAVRTVNNQVASIYRKLGAGSRAELATVVRASTPPMISSEVITPVAVPGTVPPPSGVRAITREAAASSVRARS